MSIILQNLSKIRAVLEAAKSSARILAVGKYVDDEQILEAYNVGLRDFAENYVQAALERKNRLAALMPEARWHLIGSLQSNKVNKVVGEFDLIHSVSSLKLLQKISKRASDLGLCQAVLLQVNLSGEESKDGFSAEEIEENFVDFSSLASVQIQGLMTMAPRVDGSKYTESQVSTLFADLSALVRRLNEIGPAELCEISMGMSDDFALAINQGSTMIRIGKKLFA